MLSIRITPEAKVGIFEQFAFMELRESGLFIYREPDAADVVRSPEGHSQWNIQRGRSYVVQFVELPSEAIASPHLIVVDGIRIVFSSMSPQPPNTALVISQRENRLCVSDGEQLPKAEIQLGPVIRGDVVSTSGEHRLRLISVAHDRGFSFHSVRFEKLVDGAWKPELTLTRDQFQSNHKFGRWISDLHAVQDDSGIVIVQVGEYAKSIDPIPGSSSSVLYSWRAWDLRKNVEVRRLKDCDRPFDPLE